MGCSRPNLIQTDSSRSGRPPGFQTERWVRRRVLRWFVRRGWLTDEHRQEMQRWAHSGGFSIDAAVRVEGWDRDGLERLLRYFARPPFALERLEAIGTDRLVYHLPKPGAAANAGR